MLKIHSISNKIIIFMGLTMFLVVFYFTYYRLIPLQKRFLYANINERAETTIELSKTLIKKALELQDDLLLLAQIQSIMRLDNTTRAFIMNNNGRIIVHNLTSEWDKEYTDAVTQKAVGTENIFMQKQTNSRLFSYPINDNYILFVEFSTTSVAQILSNIKKSMGLVLIILFLIIIIAVMLFVKIVIAKPFRKFEDILRSVLLTNDGKIKINYIDEFTNIVHLLNDIIGKNRRNLEEGKQAVKQKQQQLAYTLHTYINKMKLDMPGKADIPIIVFDYEHMLIGYSISFMKKLGIKTEPELYTHILDIPVLKTIANKLELDSNHDSYNDIKLNNISIRIDSIVDNENNCQGKVVSAV